MPSHRVSLIAVMLCSVLLCAQTRPAAKRQTLPNSTKIAAIQVEGSKRYPPSELVTATGLRIGAEGTEEALKAGAELLAASGMFTEVTYSYESWPDGTRVKYQVKDVETLYPAYFDNFVWLQHDELIQALKKRRPLFTGKLANGGEMYTQLAADMKTILEEKQVAGTVRMSPLVPKLGGEIAGFIYHVEGIPIPIRKLEFPGANPEMAEVLQKTAAVKIDTDYTDSGLRAFTQMDLLPQYLKRGYLRARFHAPEFTLTDAASNAVAVRVAVEEGSCYQLAELKWAGNAAFAAQELAKTLKVQIGKPANLPQLEEDMFGARRLYETKGYMVVRLVPVPLFDDPAKAVVFRVDVKEGEQYRFCSVRLEGAPEGVKKKFAELWKLRPGDVFDGSHFGVVLKELSKTFDLRNVGISLNQSLNEETKTVEVVLKFTAH